MAGSTKCRLHLRQATSLTTSNSCQSSCASERMAWASSFPSKMSFIAKPVSPMVRFKPPKITAESSLPMSAKTLAAVVRGLPPAISARTKTLSSALKPDKAWVKSTAKSSTDLPSWRPTAITWSVLSPANIFKELCTPAASPHGWPVQGISSFLPPLSFDFLAKSGFRWRRIYWWFYWTEYGTGFILSNVTLPRWHLLGKTMTFRHIGLVSSASSDLIGNKKSGLFSAFYFSLNARQGTVNLLILHSILNQIVHRSIVMTVYFELMSMIERFIVV